MSARTAGRASLRPPPVKVIAADRQHALQRPPRGAGSREELNPAERVLAVDLEEDVVGSEMLVDRLKQIRGDIGHPELRVVRAGELRERQPRIRAGMPLAPVRYGLCAQSGRE